jgi:hypothetical protein
MPKRLKKALSDENQAAFAVVEQLTKASESPSFEEQFRARMKALGRKGGKASGARRMTNLTAEQRSEIALRAAEKRWEKERARKRKK